jgi:hypothetical protein
MMNEFKTKKLSKILEKLRKKKNEKTVFKNLFEHPIKKFSNQKFRILLVLFFFSLLMVGGYLIVKILENFAFLTENNLKQKVAVHFPEPEKNLTKSKDFSNVTNINMENTTKENIKANETNATATNTDKTAAITTNTAKLTVHPQFPIKNEKIEKEVKPEKETKEKPLFTKKPHTAKPEVNPEGYFAFYSPQEGPPILREEGLLKKLLLNAEEEVKKGNYQSAKVFYEEYLAYKQDPEIYNNYGGILFLLGDYKSAEKAFTKALSLRQDPIFKLNLIIAKLKLKQYASACLMFKESQKELEKFEKTNLIKDICFSKGF